MLEVGLIMIKYKYIFEDFMYVDDKLYIESGIDELEIMDIEMSVDYALTPLEYMNLEWKEITSSIKINNFDCEYEFSYDELINIIKAFGVKEEVATSSRSFI